MKQGPTRQGKTITNEAPPLDAGPQDEPTVLPEGPLTEGRSDESLPRTRTDHTKIIPSITLSQRYDSNVLFAPSGSQIGLTPWDFVTTVNPTIQLLNQNRYAETSLKAGVSGSLFVNNPDLNFVATSLAGTAVLDRYIDRFVRGAKVAISNNFGYSPESPSFLSAADPLITDNPFARGIVPVRANLVTNTALIAASYPIAPGFVFQGTYSYSLLRVGKIFVEQAADAASLFFDTDQHAWSLGPTWQVSRTDSLSIFYRSTRASLTSISGPAFTDNFTVHGVEGTYSTVSSDWGAAVSGGASFLDVDNRPYWTGSLSLSRKYGEATTFRVIGSRNFAPNFFAGGGAIISTNAGVAVDHRFSRTLNLTATANYALNETAPVSTSSFESYSASGLLSYNISRTLSASLGYTYTYFEFNPSIGSVTNAAGYIMNRHIATFSVVGSWK